MRHTTSTLSLLFLSLACSSWGCSSESSPPPPPQPESATASEELAVEVVDQATVPAVIALQEVLGQLRLTGGVAPRPMSLVVTASGDASSGTIVIDFGAATVIYNAVFSGVLEVSYARTGQSATATLVCDELSFTARGVTLDVDGTLTISIDLSDPARVVGSVRGNLTTEKTSGGVTVDTTTTFDLTFAARAATVSLSGRIDLVSSAQGVWVVRLTDVATVIAGGQVVVDSGLLELERAQPPLHVLVVFTAPNSGSITLTPPGITSTFDL